MCEKTGSTVCSMSHDRIFSVQNYLTTLALCEQEVTASKTTIPCLLPNNHSNCEWLLRREF